MPSMLSSMPHAAPVGSAPAHPHADAPARRVLLPLITVYLVWGSTYLAVRVALTGFPPMLLAAYRFLCAGAALLLVVRVHGGARALPRARHWLAAAPVGLLLFLCGNGFVVLAEVHIGSGVTAVVVSTMPLWMAIWAMASGERPGPREWLGLAVGFGAVAVLAGGADLRASAGATLVLLLSPICWATGSTLARRLSRSASPGRPPAGLLAAAGAQMIVGGLGALLAALAAGEHMTGLPAARPLLAMIYLIAVGSLVGFTAYAWLLRHARPAIATSYAFVNPVLAVLLGSALAGEPLRWQTALATPMVALSVALVITARQRAPRAAPPDPDRLDGAPA